MFAILLPLVIFSESMPFSGYFLIYSSLGPVSLQLDS